MSKYMRFIAMLLVLGAVIATSTTSGMHMMATAAGVTAEPDDLPPADVLTSGPDIAAVEAPRAEREFLDLPTDHWAYDDILTLYDLGLMGGDDRGYIYPDRPISRAQLAKLLVEAGGYTPGSGPAIPTFTDVQPGDWHYPYVEMAYRMALMQGFGSQFKPNDQVPREELATAATRFKAWENVARGTTYSAALAALPYEDRYDISPSIRSHVAVAVERGLIDGVTDDTFGPHTPVTRAEAARLVATHLLPRPEGNEITIDGVTFRYLEEYDMLATAYGAGEPWLSDITFLGLRVREGIIAVDPDVIPLGSHLYVEGYGFGVAADTGRLIKGHKVDLYYEHDAKFVYHFGIQPRRVFLLDKP